MVKRDTGSTTCNTNYASKQSKVHKKGQPAKSFKQVTKTNVLGDMSESFSQFVKQHLDQQGIEFDSLQDEEKKLIFDAIQKTLVENEIVESFQTGANKSSNINTNKNITKSNSNNKS